MEHEKCDYIRAVLEGVAMNLGIILEKQRENGEFQDLVLTGGGAKGDTLSQILADVLGVRPAPAGSGGDCNFRGSSGYCRYRCRCV